jgi:hypothetical protein
MITSLDTGGAGDSRRSNPTEGGGSLQVVCAKPVMQEFADAVVKVLVVVRDEIP